MSNTGPIAESAPSLTAEQVVLRDHVSLDKLAATAFQADLIASIEEKIIDLGILIELDVPAGRNKALAKTALEDVHLRAVRAVAGGIG